MGIASAESNMKDWLDEIKWDNDGLVPAIAQDDKTAEFPLGQFFDHRRQITRVADQPGSGQ